MVVRNDDGGSIDNCPICLEAYEPEQDVLFLECRHIFHKPCSVQWFDKQSHCPMCRAKQENHRHMIKFGVWRQSNPFAPESDFPEWFKRQGNLERIEQTASDNQQ